MIRAIPCVTAGASLLLLVGVLLSGPPETIATLRGRVDAGSSLSDLWKVRWAPQGRRVRDTRWVKAMRGVPSAPLLATKVSRTGATNEKQR